MIEFCTVITIQANEKISQLHDRMPVIVQKKYYNLWLDTKTRDKNLLQQVMRPYSSQVLEIHSVSLRANSPDNEILL